MLTRTALGLNNVCRPEERIALRLSINRRCTLVHSSAFWSIALHPEDRDKTAFGTRSHGQLRLKRMPFGLTNATATYARALAFVLRGLLWKICVAYCDDTVLWGKTFEDHMESLHAVFKRYPIHNVNVKISKCHVACSKTEFVGH